MRSQAEVVLDHLAHNRVMLFAAEAGMNLTKDTADEFLKGAGELSHNSRLLAEPVQAAILRAVTAVEAALQACNDAEAAAEHFRGQHAPNYSPFKRNPSN